MVVSLSWFAVGAIRGIFAQFATAAAATVGRLKTGPTTASKFLYSANLWMALTAPIVLLLVSSIVRVSSDGFSASRKANFAPSNRSCPKVLSGPETGQRRPIAGSAGETGSTLDA